MIHQQSTVISEFNTASDTSVVAFNSPVGQSTKNNGAQKEPRHEERLGHYRLPRVGTYEAPLRTKQTTELGKGLKSGAGGIL